MSDQLSLAASSYDSVISGLISGPWHGLAAISMAASAAPYVAWMRTTAAQCADTAAQAGAAAAAYEAARGMAVPLPVIAANRAQLESEVAKNFLGLNTPAIATTDAEYSEMWAQDAAAMYVYAGDSAAAATLTEFVAPQQASNANELGAQVAAIAKSTPASAVTNAQALLSQLTASVPHALEELAAPAKAPVLEIVDDLDELLKPLSRIGSLSSIISSAYSVADKHFSFVQAIARAITPATQAATHTVGSMAPAMGGALGAAGVGLGPARVASVAAGLGRAGSLGALSVPASWAASAPVVNPGALAALPSVGAATAAGNGAEHMFGGLPLAPSAGVRGVASMVCSDLKIPPRAFAMPRPPAAG